MPFKCNLQRYTELQSLMLDPNVSAMIKKNVGSLRAVVVRAVGCGLPVPALTSALQYFDAMRRSRGPANIIQAQRDAFGGAPLTHSSNAVEP